MPPKQKQKQKQKQQQSTKVVVNIGEQKKRRVVRRKKPSDSKQQPPQAPPRPPTVGGFPSFAPFSPIYQPPRQVYMGQPAYAEPLVAQSGRPVMTDVERQLAGRERMLREREKRVSQDEESLIDRYNEAEERLNKRQETMYGNYSIFNPINQPINPFLSREQSISNSQKPPEPIVKREEPFSLPRFQAPPVQAPSFDFGRLIRGEPVLPPLERPPMINIEEEEQQEQDVALPTESQQMIDQVVEDQFSYNMATNPEAIAKREERRLAREEKERERQARYGRFNN